MNTFKLVLVVLFCFFTLNSAQTEKKYEKSFDAKSGDNLQVNLAPGGTIIVEGWDKDQVKIEGYVKSRKGQIEVDIDNTSNGVKIRVENVNRNSRNVRCKFKIMVPTKYNLDLYTAGGSINLDNVDGRIEGKTMGGSLDFNKLSGEIYFTTMGGSVEVENCNLDGKIKTMGGSLEVEESSGSLDITTMGGSINVRNVKMASNNRDGVRLSTMGGSIDVDGSEYGVDVETKGGSISITDVKEFVKAETMGGGIKMRRIDGSVNARTMGGSIYCQVIGDSEDKDITLISKGGDIELYVPEDFDMEFDIEIKIVDGHGNNHYEIFSDFKTNTNVTDDDDDGYNRRYRSSKIYSEGSNGNKKNRVRIKTVNGNVYLKKN